jgi:hypothetical protein
MQPGRLPDIAQKSVGQFVVVATGMVYWCWYRFGRNELTTLGIIGHNLTAAGTGAKRGAAVIAVVIVFMRRGGQ